MTSDAPSPGEVAGEVAVVTIARGRHDHLRRQLRSLARATPPRRHVVVAMGDPALEDVVRREASAATAGETSVVHVPAGDRLPLAAARNRGAEAALAAGAQVLVFLDVDCLAGPGLLEGYRAAVIEEPATVWSGPVTYLSPPGPDGYDLDSLAALDDPHPARPAPPPGRRVRGGDPDLFWSLSFALGADTWRRVGGFCEDYTGYGGEDTDFGRLVQAAGLELGWVGEARAYHQHHLGGDPPVQHAADLVRNGRLFRDRWGSWPMRGWLDELVRLGVLQLAGDDYVLAADGPAPDPAPGPAPGLARS